METPKPKILYVEDTRFLQVIIKENLRESFDIFPVSNGIEALESMAKNNYDAILLDMHMPAVNGYQFLGMIKCTYDLLRDSDREDIRILGSDEAVKKALDGDYKHIPVIVMSTEGNKYKHGIMKLGAYKIITKPYI